MVRHLLIKYQYLVQDMITNGVEPFVVHKCRGARRNGLHA